MSPRSLRVVCLAVLLGLLVCPAGGFVDPNFTPLHVHRQSATIVTLAVATMPDDARTVSLAVGQAIKGEIAVQRLTLDLAGTLAREGGGETLKELRALINHSAGSAGIAFLPGPQAENADVLLHIGGSWMRARQTARPGELDFAGIDVKLNGTFNGGSDMLVQTMRFITSHPNRPIMPVGSGIKWDIDAHRRIGVMPAGGKAAALVAVDVNGDGRLDIYAASPKGDRVFLADKDDEFVELDGLDSASVAGAWADFDGDGRADLASLSADGLRLHLQKEHGRFQTTQIKLPGPVTNGSVAIHAADLDGRGRADLIVGAGPLPIVLRNIGEGQFEPVPVQADQDVLGKLGLPGPLVVADFDGDGRVDIVQTFQNDGLLFLGRAGGFAPGRLCGAAMGQVEQRHASLADLANTGRPELVMVGGGARFVAYTLSAGRFHPVSRLLGEAGYIIQAGASCLAFGDYNNDTFIDVFVGYTVDPPQFFFNRGFRSFAICESLKLPGDEIANVEKGQAAAMWADLNNDGSAQLVVALADGSVWMSQTDLAALSQPRAVRVKIGPKLPTAGPIAVTFWSDELPLGSRIIDSRFSWAWLGLPASDTVSIRWRLPGGPEASAKLVVSEDVATCVLEP